VFVSVLIILLLLGVFVPYFNTALDQETSEGYGNELDRIVGGSSYLTIGLNLVSIPFWTFGLNAWINILILLPLRIVGLLSLWYIIFPTKS